MNNQKLPSFAAEFPADHDLKLIMQDLDEIFFLAITSDNLSDFENLDRISLVKSYRSIKDLIVSLQTQKERLIP
jgi:hypothetical protein